MTKCRIFSCWYALLLCLFVGHILIALGQIGSSLDDMAWYAQLQKDRAQLEVTRSQKLAEFARSQSLTERPSSDWLAQGYQAVSQPLSLSATHLPSESNLSLAQELR